MITNHHHHYQQQHHHHYRHRHQHHHCHHQHHHYQRRHQHHHCHHHHHHYQRRHQHHHCRHQHHHCHHHHHHCHHQHHHHHHYHHHHCRYISIMSHLPKPHHRATPLRTPALWPGPVDRACAEGLAGVRRLACLADRFPLAPSFPPLLLALQADEIWMSWQCCHCAAEQAAMAPGRVMDSPDYTGPAGGGGGGTAPSISGLSSQPPSAHLVWQLLPSQEPALPGPARVSVPKACGLCHLFDLSQQPAMVKRLFCLQMRDVRPEKGRDLQSEWLSGLGPSSVPLLCQYLSSFSGIFSIHGK